MSRSVQSPHLEQLLKKLQYQGQSNNCGPFTVATVINALCNQNLDGDELARQMNRPRWRYFWPIIRRLPNNATFPWGMVDVLREYGLEARWWLQVPIDYLRPALAKGHILLPVIGQWRPRLWAHTMALVAWSPEQGWGFANPQTRHQQIDWLTEQDFQEQWRFFGRLMVEAEA